MWNLHHQQEFKLHTILNKISYLIQVKILEKIF